MKNKRKFVQITKGFLVYLCFQKISTLIKTENWRIAFVTKKMPGWGINGVRASSISSFYRWGKRNRSWMTHSGLLLAFATGTFVSEKDKLHQTQKMLKTMPQSIKFGHVTHFFFLVKMEKWSLRIEITIMHAQKRWHALVQ